MSMHPLHALLVAASLLAPVLAIQVFDASSHGSRAKDVEAFSFADFVAKFNRSYSPSSSEWARREAVFEGSKREVLDFLAGPPQSWTKGITEFADYTWSERQAVLGYKGRRKLKASDGAAFGKIRTWSHPPEFSIMGGEGKLSKVVRHQGGCGSCWAHAATYVLEGHMESNTTLMKQLRQDIERRGLASPLDTNEAISVGAVTSCTPNPRHCGGEGGCTGATVELAYDMVKEKGVPLEIDWKLTKDGHDSCDFAKASLGITGYEVLPANKLHPLMQALYESGGPIAVSVAANRWFSYSEGIFSGCDWIVNHAVTLMGYKTPKRDVVMGDFQAGYWHIKNSWGPSWGEDGFIRLEMKEDEEAFCGEDKDAHAGIACEGDPDTAWVCGTCGVLYDSVHPTGLHLM